jgi:hypothetical protein
MMSDACDINSTIFIAACIELKSGCYDSYARVQGVSPAGQRRGRPSETALAGFAPGSSCIPSKAPDRRTAFPDSRMSTFLEFFSDAADFALTLNLKAAIVAAGFIVILVLTR